MRCAKTTLEQAVDFTAAKDGKKLCKQRLVAFIGGLRGPRANPVTTTQIKKRFAAQDWDFVNVCLGDLVCEGAVRIFSTTLGRRKWNSLYTYELAA